VGLVPEIFVTELLTVMTKHSKNNTASSVFSYAEYKKLDYGTKRQRLGNESMRLFNACSLCLERARTPLACSEGHIFCTECVFTDLGVLLVFIRPWRLVVDVAHDSNAEVLKSHRAGISRSRRPSWPL